MFPSVERRPGRRAALWLVLSLVGLAVSACAGPGAGGRVTDTKIVSSAALARVNAFRAENGRDPLRVDPHASRAARAQAANMAAHREMQHNIGFGANFARRMKRAGVPLPAAENIATGQRSVDAALAAWERSPHHRRNMLGRAYSGVGVGVATDSKTGRSYWAMVLTGG